MSLTIRAKIVLTFGLLIVTQLAGLLADLLANTTTASTNGAFVGTFNRAQQGVSILICLVAGHHFYQVICGGLNRQGLKFKALTESLDLSMRANSPRPDEFGTSAKAFDRLLDSLEQALANIRTATEWVSLATQEISAGNLDLSARTEQQAAALEQTSASMSQVAEAVKTNAARAQEVCGLAEASRLITQQGWTAAHQMRNTLDSLSGNSEKITEITSVIEGIAFQTNILALNAAVEAARAGEQGRGFAVVAAEVRNLAQRSASAAQDIKNVIASSVSDIRDGAQQAQQVQTLVEKIQASVKQVTELTASIASSSSEQSLNIDQIHEAIRLMDQSTQQNSAFVEEIAAAASSLDEQSKSLLHTVGIFKLSATVPTPGGPATSPPGSLRQLQSVVAA
ncbi:methyl-accepting chemotaxis protein [Curvibacter lanceolatus]|uniref:methyl-accepting chemotaxis protein n=1 Tax=Curvibacter lanceolatus TaxID=86182 RepID=UPI00037EF09A|nr:methyl-accepting chemotaxis protein [Curvibacter lanceolatus]